MISFAFEYVIWGVYRSTLLANMVLLLYFSILLSNSTLRISSSISLTSYTHRHSFGIWVLILARLCVCVNVSVWLITCFSSIQCNRLRRRIKCPRAPILFILLSVSIADALAYWKNALLFFVVAVGCWCRHRRRCYVDLAIMYIPSIAEFSCGCWWCCFVRRRSQQINMHKCWRQKAQRATLIISIFPFI